MEHFHVAHLVMLGMSSCVVITEVLFEFAGSDADSLRAAVHYNVDGFGEPAIRTLTTTRRQMHLSRRSEPSPCMAEATPAPSVHSK